MLSKYPKPPYTKAVSYPLVLKIEPVENMSVQSGRRTMEAPGVGGRQSVSASMPRTVRVPVAMSPERYRLS